MNWVQRKIYLYNVTFGLYMLDWWERCLFNTLVVVLMWFVFYNGVRSISELGERYENAKIQESYWSGVVLPLFLAVFSFPLAYTYGQHGQTPSIART